MYPKSVMYLVEPVVYRLVCMRRLVLLVVFAVTALGACATAVVATKPELREMEIPVRYKDSPMLVCAEARGRWVCVDWVEIEAEIHKDDHKGTYDQPTKQEPKQYDL